jgi:copper chaperone
VPGAAGAPAVPVGAAEERPREGRKERCNVAQGDAGGTALQEVVFGVNGMTCGGCSSSVRRSLEALPGVSGVEVTLSPGRAAVRYDSLRVTAAELVSAVEEAGFEVVPSAMGAAS